MTTGKRLKKARDYVDLTQNEFAEQFGFRLAVAKWDTGNRIYAEWVR